MSLRISTAVIKEMYLMLQNKIPVSVIVVTKNEENYIARCLDALEPFDDVIVVDSHSTDKTYEIAADKGVQVCNFIWDGNYPKKRQWCLEHLNLKHHWVFFVDADEVVIDQIVQEIAALFCGGEPSEVGFFVRADYVWKGKMLRYGLKNKKLVLFDSRKFEFPVINDLDVSEMGEIEGHYQPILREEYAASKIGRLESEMLHYVDAKGWEERHKRYAYWESVMNTRNAWPKDPVSWRQFLKCVFRAMPLRNVAAFLHSYIFKLGLFDGAMGFDFALSRARYYRMISDVSKSKTNLGNGFSEPC